MGRIPKRLFFPSYSDYGAVLWLEQAGSVSVCLCVIAHIHTSSAGWGLRAGGETWAWLSSKLNRL